MEPLAQRLRERARELGLSDAEVGRRAGLSERRYGNYVRGSREPDLATLLRVCSVLDLTPNDVLLPLPGSKPAKQELCLSRIRAAAAKLSDDDLVLIVVQTEALAEHRSKEA